mgnify:FL=1
MTALGTNKFIKEFWPFFPTDFTVAKEYLKEKAGKGYYLVSIDQKYLQATYRKEKPAKAYYHIGFFNVEEGHIYDSQHTDLMEKGWETVCTWGEATILKALPGTEAEEMPMRRDLAEDEKQYRKALMRSQTIPAMLLTAVFMLISVTMAEEQPLLYAGNPIQKLIAIAFGLAMVFTFVILLQCLYNAAKSRGRQRDGQEPKYAWAGRAMSRTKWYLILAAVDVACILIFIFAGSFV